MVLENGVKGYLFSFTCIHNVLGDDIEMSTHCSSSGRGKAAEVRLTAKGGGKKLKWTFTFPDLILSLLSWQLLGPVQLAIPILSLPRFFSENFFSLCPSQKLCVFI